MAASDRSGDQESINHFFLLRRWSGKKKRLRIEISAYEILKTVKK